MEKSLQLIFQMNFAWHHYFMLLSLNSGIIILNHVFHIWKNLKCGNFTKKMELLEDGGTRTTVRDVEICLNEETLRIILGVHVAGVQSIEGCKASGEFTKPATKRMEARHVALPKKYLEGILVDV